MCGTVRTAHVRSGKLLLVGLQKSASMAFTGFRHFEPLNWSSRAIRMFCMRKYRLFQAWPFPPSDNFAGRRATLVFYSYPPPETGPKAAGPSLRFQSGLLVRLCYVVIIREQ